MPKDIDCALINQTNKLYDHLADFISEQFRTKFDNRKNTPKPADIPVGYSNKYNYYLPLANVEFQRSMLSKNIDIMLSNMLTQEFETPINIDFKTETDYDPCYKLTSYYASITILTK